MMHKICLIILYILAVDFMAAGKTIEVGNSRLTLCADDVLNQLVISDSRTRREWRADFNQCAGESEFDNWQHIKRPQYRKFDLQSATILDDVRTKLTVMDTQSGQIYYLDAAVNDSTVTFELYADDLSLPMTCVGLPPVFTSDLDEGYLVFCDRSSGVLKSQSDPEGYAGWILSTYANTSCLDMPWIGIFDMKKGDGVMVLFETPLCSAMHLKKLPDGIWPQPLWQGSMGTMAFRRRLSYRFSDGGGYVALAKMYREYQDEQGRIKTLAQKAAERPNVARLAGSPPIWGDGDVFEFLQDARNLGVTRATFCNAERGGRGRADMEKLNAMGYLTLRYDSYSDILEGKTWFQKDDIQKTAQVMLPGGELLKGWKTLEGLQYYSRSSACALNAAQTYSKALIEDVGFNTHFIDVMCAMDVTEDYHPDHTFDRRQDMLNKREVLKYYTDQNLVLGTEHGNDWAIDEIDYTEGSLSGSLWWTAGGNKTGWNPGHLQSPKSRDDFSALYLKYGVSPKNRIPLWQLVYHDCSVSTWYWGDSPGWFYELASEISAQKDLTAMLYGASSLFWRDDFRGYGWPKHKDRFMESYYLTSKFHEAVFGHQMISHEFVTTDRLVQKTIFDNGAVVWANFKDEPFEISVDRRRIQLAANGFYAKAPAIEQGCILQDGNEITFVDAKDFFFCKALRGMKGEELSIDGEIVLFKLSESQWNLLFWPNGETAELDLDRVKERSGWSDVAIRLFSKDWKPEGRVDVETSDKALLKAGAYLISEKR